MIYVRVRDCRTSWPEHTSDG